MALMVAVFYTWADSASRTAASLGKDTSDKAPFIVCNMTF